METVACAPPPESYEGEVAALAQEVQVTASGVAVEHNSSVRVGSAYISLAGETGSTRHVA